MGNSKSRNVFFAKNNIFRSHLATHKSDARRQFSDMMEGFPNHGNPKPLQVGFPEGTHRHHPAKPVDTTISAPISTTTTAQQSANDPDQQQQPLNPPHPNSITHLIKFTASFTSTASRPAKEQNHYETLSLPVTATADEIKKKFYALSLKHHPDRNRSDPSSSQRFARLSAAYNVLGNTSKRQSYDRDHGFHHTQHAHRHPTTPAGSHSSHSAHAHHSSGGSYAGSRPASGLSKRRGTFTGPPPSFYANGGYGRTGRTASEGGFEGAFGFGGSGGAGGAGGGAGSGNEWADFTAEHKRGRGG
ncbi:DnaJ-domain-containing protein [Penicillium cosmopolitanum]|uniref:DnaJ-domain-containing protein n=1 Tax=Penicillium cosmopolitanum TaxID=1131564 RepID=A0A9W9W4H6_9EURO|nr:DnaJ-domain-containing protein [Penicillium cosmopolitanum]KAJ5403276.1 DnaJ-domain-containing protein [Penicillium cosmopolitanum]